MRTDAENYEAVRRLKDILRKKGVLHALKRQGALPGARITFGNTKHTEIEL